MIIDVHSHHTTELQAFHAFLDNQLAGRLRRYDVL